MRWLRLALLATVLVGPWVFLQIVFRDTFLLHDSLKHGFPMFFKVAQETTCAGLPRWLGTLDSGSPVVIYVISTGLTHLVRLPALYLAGCLRLDLVPALSLYKAQAIASYLVLAGGMFVLGRVLFEHRLAAVHLFLVTLYAGMFLDASHSSQVVAIVFWMPWIVAAAVKFHRGAASPRAACYLNAVILFACLPTLDQYPHYTLLTLAVGTGLYVAMLRRDAWTRVRPHLLRLWPAALVLAVTAFELWTVKGTIAGYKPSFRADLIVNPKVFGETGFVQPTALIGSLLPLGFLAGFEDLGNSLLHAMGRKRWWLYPLRVGTVSRAFIFRLDELLFVVGFVALVLALVFVLRKGDRRRIVWTGFALALFLVALQQTRIYYLLFRLPLFNVFRIYFLYVVNAVFAVLVMSGYGMDAYLQVPASDRRRLLRRSLGIVLALTAVAGLAVALLLRGAAAGTARRMVPFVALDLASIAVGTGAVWWCSRASRPARCATALMVVLALSQTVYLAGALRLLGVPRAEVLERYGLDEDDRTAAPADVASDPNGLRRKECDLFAQCYLSRRDTVSLRKDEEGTFLRNRNEAVFQDGLETEVVQALAGVSHPVYWLARTAISYTSRDELVTRLNAHRDDIGAHLRDVVYLARRDLDALALRDGVSAATGELSALARRQDLIHLRYRTDAPMVLNAAITYDRYWVASVNGRSVEVRRGNFNGLAVPLPAGTGKVELAYRSPSADLFFYSRYACLVAGVLAAGLLARSVLAGGGRSPH